MSFEKVRYEAGSVVGSTGLQAARALPGSGTWIYGAGTDGPARFTANARVVTDLTGHGTDIITSDTAEFTDDDLHTYVDDYPNGGIGLANIRIIEVISSTTARLDRALDPSTDGATGTGTVAAGLVYPGSFTDVTIEEGASVTWPAIFSPHFWLHCSGTFTINGTLDLRPLTAAVGRLVPQTITYNGLPLDVSSTGFTGDAADTSGDASVAANGGTLTSFALPDPFTAMFYALAAPSNLFGSHGRSGGGDGVYDGGAGGPQGFWSIIVARHIVHGDSNLYDLRGGDGGDAGDDGAGNLGNGDCGGGGGGAAGWWMTISDDLTGDANILAAGGAGGAGCGSGEDGLSGADGFPIHVLNA